MARSRLILALAGAGAIAAAGAGIEVATRGDDAPPLPATEHVLLPAPNPAAGTSRGVFVRDPQGQIEHLAASGHLVAWSVRTPADRFGPESDAASPLTLPTSSKVVVVDERGGPPATVDVSARWVRSVQFVRNAAGVPSQLAISSCTGRARTSCRAELVAVDAEPRLTLGPPTSDPLAGAAAAGHVDVGQRLNVGSRQRLADGKRSCVPQLSVDDLATGAHRELPPIPERRAFAKDCLRFLDATIRGDFVLATVSRREPASPEASEFDADVVEIIQLETPTPRWIPAQMTSSGTDYGGEVLEGTAFTAAGPVWQAFNSDTYEATTLQRMRLPEGLTARDGKPAGDIADGVKPGAPNGCALAATDAAIYELANARCAVWTPAEERRVTNGIRRLVAPVWRRAEEW